MFFSVIIPTININKFLNKNLEYLSKQIFKNFEVIVISENNFEKELSKYDLNIKFIFNKDVFSPGEKRNLAVNSSRGKYLAFIDDDAYPQDDWLHEAFKKLENIDDYKCCLGGPGIMPEDENFFGKCTDLFFKSPIFHSDNYRYKVDLKLNNKKVTDWPSVNFIISKIFYKDLGGFNKIYWPGEDSKLCEQILINNGTIIYTPNIVVNHYKRSNIYKHIKQIFRYGLHRGLFFKKGDQNSFKLKYTIPSLFLLSHVFILINSSISYFIFAIYLLFLISEIFLIKNLKNNLIIFLISRLIIYISHISYGYGFFIGLFKKNYDQSLYR